MYADYMRLMFPAEDLKELINSLDAKEEALGDCVEICLGVLRTALMYEGCGTPLFRWRDVNGVLTGLETSLMVFNATAYASGVDNRKMFVASPMTSFQRGDAPSCQQKITESPWMSPCPTQHKPRPRRRERLSTLSHRVPKPGKGVTCQRRVMIHPNVGESTSSWKQGVNWTMHVLDGIQRMLENNEVGTASVPSMLQMIVHVPRPTNGIIYC